MRKKLGCALLTLLLGAGALTAMWWFRSPRLDSSTPASQGTLTLRRVYVAEGRLFGESAFRPVKSIVLEFQVPISRATAHLHRLPLRIVTSDGVTEWVEAEEKWNIPRGFWARFWQSLLLRLHISRIPPRILRAYIPVAYSSTARYLDVYAVSPSTRGYRWRLVGLPRATHAITPPVQVVDGYRCEDFQIRARALQVVSANYVRIPAGIELIFDAQVNAPPSPNLMLNVALRSITPAWAPGSPILANANEVVSQGAVTAGTARVAHFLLLPFVRHQRYIRVECEGWLARHQSDRRTLRLPVRRITTASGKKLLVIAPPRNVTVNLIGGTVSIPAEPGLSHLPEVQAVSPSGNRIFFFYQRKVRYPSDKHSLDVSVVVPEPGKSYVPRGVSGGLEHIMVILPPGKPVPEELHVHLRGTEESWRGKQHRFTLTLPVR